MFVAVLEQGSFADGLFKCSQRRVRDYSLLNRYLKSMLSISGVPRNGEYRTHQTGLLFH